VSVEPGTISQNADIRYLGRLLGDVIRTYGGQQLFERTEAIRASSVQRHRGLADDSLVSQNLAALSLDETLGFVRGFMLFSMLANLAEDRQGRLVESEVDLASSLRELAAAGIDAERVAGLLDQSLIVPVLTAHPTG
jgi:phosphoenolpyruvate carboxylase